MASEQLRMMSNDARLTSSDVSYALKHLLAKRLRREVRICPNPILMQTKRLRRPAPLAYHSYSPDLSTAGLSPGIVELPSLTSSTGNLSLLSAKTSIRERFSSHPSAPHSSLPRSLCKPHSDVPYEYDLIQTAFNQLYIRLKCTDGTRISAEGYYEIHVNNVKQYLLESYVACQIYLTALLTPFKASKWVDVRSFTASIEAIQLINFDRLSLNKDDLAIKKNNNLRQKLLCNSLFSLLQISRFQAEKRLIKPRSEDSFQPRAKNKEESEL